MVRVSIGMALLVVGVCVMRVSWGSLSFFSAGDMFGVVGMSASTVDVVSGVRLSSSGFLYITSHIVSFVVDSVYAYMGMGVRDMSTFLGSSFVLRERRSKDEGNGGKKTNDGGGKTHV